MTYPAHCVTSDPVAIVRRMRRQRSWRSLLTSKGPPKEVILGKNHYSYGKHVRELAKKQKQEEKQQRKEARRNPQPAENDVKVDVPAVEEAQDSL